MAPLSIICPIVEVNRSSIITCEMRGLCIKITCPTCNHENEHGPSEGHRVCNGWQDGNTSCTGYVRNNHNGTKLINNIND